MESIDLLSFLRNYYGIVNQSLKINKLSHADMKVLFPNIRRTSLEYLKNNIGLVYSGDIVLVHDSKGLVLPYINPRLEFIIEECDYPEYEEVETIDISKVDLNNLSKNELLRLRKKLKRTHQVHEEKRVVNEIRKKKDKQTIKYKREKMLLKVEG